MDAKIEGLKVEQWEISKLLPYIKNLHKNDWRTFDEINQERIGG